MNRRMTCPWLVETEKGYECSAVSPPAKVDFSESSPPNVNGEICKLPEPTSSINPPWDQCKRFKPSREENETSRLAEGFMNINRGIIYVSIFLIIAIGIIMNLSKGQIVTGVSILMIILIILANIGYLYTRNK